MDKQEFLVILRDSLNGEVMPSKVEETIRFYDNYIGNNSAEDKLFKLGDPRLIAKSIIEAERVAMSKGSRNKAYKDEYSDWNESNNNKSKKNRSFNFNINGWYNKMILAIVLLVIVSVFIMITSIAFRIFFTISTIVIKLIFTLAIPILMVILIYSLFRKR